MRQLNVLKETIVLYVSYSSTWKCLILTGLSLGNKRLFFSQLFGCPKANSDIEWYAI